jgi:uncharacterized membrane protein YhaH (DUF805 family)
MLVTVPVLSIGTAVGRSAEYVQYDEERGLAFIAQVISIALAAIVVVWTVRRLHDIGKTGWFSFLLIPPFTVFLWAYLLIANYDKNENNKWGNHSEKLRLFGIEATNLWRLFAIMTIVLLMTFLGFIFYSIYSSL